MCIQRVRPFRPCSHAQMGNAVLGIYPKRWDPAISYQSGKISSKYAMVAFITPSILVPFLIPFVDIFVLAIGRDVQKGFLKLSKLTEL